MEPKLGGVDTGEVACSAGLVLLGAEGKAVHGDGIGDCGGSETCVGVPNLVAGEVLEIAGGKPIGTVEDDLGLHLGCCSSDGCDGSGCCVTSDVTVGCGGAESRAWCSNPDEFLNGVIEVKADGVGDACTGAGLGLVLELVDEVLVGVLGELATLGCVEVNVVGIDVEVNSGVVKYGWSRNEGGRKGKGDVELNFVVLESN